MEKAILDAIESRTRKDLMALQAQPLEVKVALAKKRIKDFYEHFNGHVCVSFSGGKDSTVLLDLVRERYPDVRAVFSDTGLEYPEIRAFARGFDNVDVVRPTMRFDQVISTYGYPLISKEVAEAISYARRIRSQSLNVERERERAAKNGTLGPQGEWKRLELGGAAALHQDERREKPPDDPHRTLPRRGEWEDWRRRCL